MVVGGREYCPIDVALMPPGPHKIRIELVDANHQVFPGQSKTVTFTSDLSTELLPH